MDVVTAFLNPALNEEVYMAHPEGFEEDGKVCLLQKTLYGLKQAPREWYSEINRHLNGIGFTNSSADPNLYISKNTILILFVDDILIISIDKKSEAETKQLLMTRWEMVDLGDAGQFLGIQIF